MNKKFDMNKFNEWLQDNRDMSMCETASVYVERKTNEAISYCTNVLGLHRNDAFIIAFRRNLETHITICRDFPPQDIFLRIYRLHIHQFLFNVHHETSSFNIQLHLYNNMRMIAPYTKNSARFFSVTG